MAENTWVPKAFSQEIALGVQTHTVPHVRYDWLFLGNFIVFVHHFLSHTIHVWYIYLLIYLLKINHSCREKKNTPGASNSSRIPGKWGKWTRVEPMHFLLEIRIFQPAMLVYQRSREFPGAPKNGTPFP